VVDPARARSRLDRDDDAVGTNAPTSKRWWMPVLIVVVQASLGLSFHLATNARSEWPPGRGENDVIRFLVVPFFLGLTYTVHAVTRDWMVAGAAILVALVGPMVVEGSAIGLTAWLVGSPTEGALVAAGIAGFVLSIALAALWAHLTLRAYAKREPD
jgi:hypothetical protein